MLSSVEGGTHTLGTISTFSQIYKLGHASGLPEKCGIGQGKLGVIPFVPKTPAPTPAPTVAPTTVPTLAPTVAPTVVPTMAPSAVPSAVPSYSPTAKPSKRPTDLPTTSAKCP